MKCVVTAGPTYELLDKVRRLTNFSTGRLGAELAAFLTERGHDVNLLLGEQATYRGEMSAPKIEHFSTTADLRERLEVLGRKSPDAIFHAAAVSDFTFGKIWSRTSKGALKELKSGKITTRDGNLLAELVPTPKIIAELRSWHPKALLVGWKYAVDGNRQGVIGLGEKQIRECRTDACVVNGPAYGLGFGLVIQSSECAHFRSPAKLFAILEELVHAKRRD